ncbi:MAG: thioredoxin domain-containing protein [Terriglobales bacterium]|jgi:protein-disulfide isomerase
MHRKSTCLLIVLMSALFAGAQQKPAAKPASTASTAAKAKASPGLPSEDTVNAFMQQTFGYNPQLSWKIQEIKPAAAQGLAEVDVLIVSPEGQQIDKFYVSPDGEHALVGDVIPFGAHPFVADFKKLKKGIDGPTRGPADAPVTIVEFSDLQCPHCKEAQPTIEKLLADEKNVRLVFQNFPLPMHNWAAKAAAYADCVASTSNDAAWKFIQGTYDAQADITEANADEKLNAIADAAGAKSADIAACAAKSETIGRVERSVELGKSLNVNSTPTLFINGRQVGGSVPYDALKSLVDFAAQQPK